MGCTAERILSECTDKISHAATTKEVLTMPCGKKSRKNIGSNITRLENKGYPYNQALAIALRKAGVRKR